MLYRLTAAFAALAMSATTTAAAPLEAYGKLPAIEQVEISPGGGYVAYLVTNGEKRTIAIQTTADHKVQSISRAGSEKVRDIQWAGEQHLIVTTSTSKLAPGLQGAAAGEYLGAQDLNLATGRSHGLLDNVRQGAEQRNAVLTADIVLSVPDVRTIGGKPVAFFRGEYLDKERAYVGLYRADLDTNTTWLVERGAREAYDWVISPDGRTVAQAAYNDNPGTWTLMLKGAAGVWRPTQTLSAPIETPELAGLGRDGGSVLVQLQDEKLGSMWRELSTATGAWGETVVSGDDMPIHDPATGRLIGESALVGDEPTSSFFDPHDAAIWRAVAKAFPGDLVSLSSWSVDRKHIVVRVDSAELGPAYALVDLNTKQADWLGSEYDLKAGDISPVKPVHYQAADGLEISGYLILPAGREAHGLPLVVLAHGGPAARDMPGFDWWAQALASRGYAVLRANFRGSDGFGWDFLARGFGEWGRKMQTDLSDGVRDLVRQGIIDPKRVCIVGASYGGYAALAGATIDHGVYRCAVSVGGVSDLRALTADDLKRFGHASQRYWFRFIGAQSSNDPVMAKYSPLARAGEADIPILLLHGRDDSVVPISQSRRMAEALRAAGKPVELVELAGEDHWLSRGETRLQMLQATVAFLEKNNPPN
jgi:acetyl esterase/lipase